MASNAKMTRQTNNSFRIELGRQIERRNLQILMHLTKNKAGNRGERFGILVYFGVSRQTPTVNPRIGPHIAVASQDQGVLT
jgi:hypothetical protein